MIFLKLSFRVRQFSNVSISSPGVKGHFPLVGLKMAPSRQKIALFSRLIESPHLQPLCLFGEEVLQPFLLSLSEDLPYASEILNQIPPFLCICTGGIGSVCVFRTVTD